MQATARAFVEAERRCCPTIGWYLEPIPAGLRLQITATADQLDLLATLLTVS